MGSGAWLIGDFDAAEFSPAVEWLRERATCTSFGDPRDAIARCAPRGASLGLSAHEPAAVVFCAARPGSISHAQVDALSRAFPLARLMALVGSWCAGEVRSGRPWPGVPRIDWHRWQTRLPELMDEIDGATPVRPPRTMTEVDVLLSSQAQARPPKVAARVAIITDRRVDFESLCNALSLTTNHCQWLLPDNITPPSPVDVLLVDATANLGAADEDLNRVRSSLGPLPALVLGHFPRPDEHRDLLAMPRTAFLAKPYLQRDLLLSLAALLGTLVEQVSSSASAAA